MNNIVQLELLQKQTAAIDDAVRPNLKSGGGGGTFEGMELVDAKIAAAEARTDTKFAEVLGEIKAVRADLSHMPSTWAMIGTMGAFSAIGVGTLLAILAFGGDRFDGGVSVGQSGVEAKIALDRVVSENVAQTKQIEMLSLQVQEVLQAVSQDKRPPVDQRPEFPMPTIPQQ